MKSAKIYSPPADPTKGRYVRARELFDAGMSPADIVTAINHEYPSKDQPFTGDDMAILLEGYDEANA